MVVEERIACVYKLDVDATCASHAPPRMRRRCACAALVAEHDPLLDEPTNHRDVEASMARAFLLEYRSPSSRHAR